jgi:sporulation protein YlmC with PRC-barrel domain
MCYLNKCICTDKNGVGMIYTPHRASQRIAMTTVTLLMLVAPVAASAQNREKDSVVPTFKELRPASSVIGWQLRRGDNVVGTIDDLVFDLETSEVALLVIAEKDGAGTTRYLAIPTAILEPVGRSARVASWVTDGMVEKARRVAKQTDCATRGWAAEEYKTFGRDPYWKEFRDQLFKENPQARFDEVEHRLELYSQLRNKKVVDNKGQMVGQIADFGIEPVSDSIAYAVLQPSDKNALFNAIPLGAFVAQDDSNHWLIELGPEAITQQAKFEEWQWPTSTSRGWIEYIAVRYGRSGLQTQRKTK